MAVASDEVEKLNKEFLKFMSNPEDVEKAIEEIYDDLVDEVLMGFVFEAHRRAKFGVDAAEDGITDDASFSIVDRPGVDVFGEPMTRKNGKCACPNCGRKVTANRYATHLERCLGMGRSSTRLASQRLSINTGSLSRDQSSRSADEIDDDWTMIKKRKRKTGKKMVKRAYVRLKRGNNTTSSDSSS